jgi:hypothetical protein
MVVSASVAFGGFTRAANPDPVLVASVRSDDWPKRGHGVTDHVIWIDAPGDHAERVLAAAREAFRLR